MANIYAPYFDSERAAPEGFRAQRALLGRQVGAQRLGLSLWMLPPGQTAYPFHFHLNDEELIVVLEGRLSVRTPTGRQELAEGDVAWFGTGQEGAHQVSNWGEHPARFLAFSPAGQPDVVVYPDSHKLSAGERRAGGFAVRVDCSESAQMSYWEGESPPARP